MPLKNEVELIVREMEAVRSILEGTLRIVPSFDITNAKILPYGLKAHTRSISWIVEQVITQQTKYNAAKLGLQDVNISMPDTSLHDCIVTEGDNRYFVNVKIHQANGKQNKNDISAVEKLYMQYVTNPNYRLIYACVAIRFENVTISFPEHNVHVFSPQFLPIYVNPRNDKIQCTYKHDPEHRTRTRFLQLLRKASKSIILD